MLKKTLNSSTIDSFETILINTSKEIKTIIENNPEEAYFLQAFDLSSWIESKIIGTDFKTAYYKNNLG